MLHDTQRNALIDALTAAGHLKTEAVTEAMRSVKRELFVPPYRSHRAYEDAPISIGFDATISAPHMVAIMTEALDAKPGQRILEVGSGSGYQAAILSHIVGPKGRIVTIERVGVLATRARRALEGAGVKNVEVHEGDGSKGHPTAAPYDRILVTAGAPGVPPPLVEQLTSDGILVLPIGNDRCELTRVKKSGGKATTESLGPCAFVPLKGAFGQGSTAFAT